MALQSLVKKWPAWDLNGLTAKLNEMELNMFRLG